MAHGWNPYFHNPTSLSSDPRTLRTSESEQNLSQHIEHFSGHHGFTGSVASQETPVYNSNYNMNYCSNPSVTDSSLDCVYQGYCRETQWQANEEQIEKDYLQECRASNNPDFVSESFPSSFATEFQGLKQDCGVPSTSFLENYSDVSSCSDADANETRPPCKFMPSKSFPEPTVEVPQNHNSSEWYFPHTSNMTVLTESVCPNMAERNVNCEESLECQSAKQAVTTYTACDRSSTASYILTTEGQTVHDRSYLDACQGLKQKDNIERDPTQAISTSSFESSGDESNEYQEYSKEEQIPLDPPNSISALNQEQLDEKISRNEPDKLFCKENESFDHPYSPTDQEEKLNAGIQNISEVSEVKRKETGERDDENSGVHNSSIPSSTNCSDENAEMDSREMLLETEAPLAKDTTDQLLKSSVHASQPKSNEISVQDTICRNLAEQSDAIVPKLSESFLQQKTSSTNTSLCPLEDGTSSKEQKNEAICTGDGIVDVALEQKDHSIGIHVESKKLQESSNMEINDSLEKEMVEPVKEVPASPPDQNDGSQSAVSDSLSVTTNDSLQDKGFGGQGVTSDDLSIDTSWENKQQSGVHLESSLEPKSSNMGLDSCVERKVSQEAKKSPTSVPNRDSTCSDKNKQGVIPNPCHSKSCIHPQNINTDMSSYVKEELTNSPGKTSPSSSPEQACSHPSEVNDGDENKESVANHSELPLRPEGSNTDIQPYLENEVTDRPQNKNSSSSLILDCSILSDTVSIDGGDENKQSTACHSDSPLPPENLSPDTHSSLEKERASPGEKLSQTFSPEQNCSDPHVGDSLSVDINDANKQNDANNLESSLQCDSSNTDMHPCLENQWTNESSSTDPEYTSHNVTTNSNNQNVLSSLETCLEPDTSNSCTSVSEKEWTRPIEKNATTFPDVQESLRESPVAEDLASLTGDFSENARESFEDMDSSIEEQPVPDILFGEPLSREDSLCDSDDMKPLSSQDGDDMDPSEREVLILKTSAQMRKRLQPIVILKSLESSNVSNVYHCAKCQHTADGVDDLIDHYHSCQSMLNFHFCTSCNIYLTRNEQGEKHVCGTLKERPELFDDSSSKQKDKRHRRYKCNRCGLILSKIMHYIRHMRSHTGTTPFRCNDCGVYFSQSSCLYKHKRVPGRCKKSKPPFTNSSAVASKTKTSLKKGALHAKSAHMRKCYVKLVDILTANLCSMCLKSFSSKKKAKKHSYNVHNGKSWVISLDQGTTQVTLQKMKEENEKSGNYKCPLCPQLFKSTSRRARHLRDCVRAAVYGGKKKVGDKYICPLCRTTFSAPSNRYRHLKSSCLKKCLSRLAKQAKFRRKIESQTNKENELKAQSNEVEQKKAPAPVTATPTAMRFKCSLCPAVFAYPSGKYRHMKKHELFKLTGKLFKYRNSRFSALPSQETANGTKDEESKNQVKDEETEPELSLSCHFCEKSFNTLLSLKSHERSHRGERPYRCLECGKGFKARAHLLGHKVVHQRRIQCTVCRKILPTIGELIQHRTTHLKRGMLQCPDCKAQFHHPAHLLRHLKTHQKKEQATQLEEKTSLKPQQSLYSDKKHHELKEIQCSLCKEVFSDAQVLRKHCLTHISGSNQCPFCKINFTNRSCLLRHMIRHTGDKPYSCHTCGKQFYREVFLTLHSKRCSQSPVIQLESATKDTLAESTDLKSTYPESIPPKSTTKPKKLHHCSQCPRKFSKKSRFLGHIRGHELNYVKPCPGCGECYGPSRMSQHRKKCKATHEIVPDLPSSSSSSQTVAKTSQNGHKKASLPFIPIKNLRLKCSYCSKFFKYRCYLLRHLVTHTGVLPYACMHCGQRYRSNTLCLQHEAFCGGIEKKDKIKAATEKPSTSTPVAEQEPEKDDETELKCKFCNKTFNKLRYLRRHILTHNEVKPYRCKACDSCFSRYDHLKVHQTRCKGKRSWLEVRIPKISLEDVGKGWQKKFGSESSVIQETFQCKVCSKSFTAQSKLSRHFSLLHAVKLFKCEGCGSSFSHEKTLKKHRKIKKCKRRPREKNASLQNASNPPIDSGTRLLSGRNLQLKIQPIFNKTHKYVCSYCPRTFKLSWQLGSHTRLHTGEKPFSCNYCGERFIRKDYVQRHLLKCPKVEQGKVLCERCGGFFLAQTLENHKKSCSTTLSSTPPKPSAVGKDLCDICGGFFPAKMLESHKKSCNSPSSTPSAVDQNQRSLSQTLPKGFSCAYCSARFLLFSQLQEHFLSTHKLESVAQPMSTAPLQQLLSNIKEEPVEASSDCPSPSCKMDSTGLKAFHCKECNAAFVNKAGLTGHLRTHAKQHPFNCKICNRGFWNKNLLRNHYRKCRSGRIQQSDVLIKAENYSPLDNSVTDNASEAPGIKDLQTNLSSKDDAMDESPQNLEGKKTVQYQCSECDKSFTDGLLLISHLENHGREEQERKRNTCPKCGRVCSSQAHLEKHMKTHGTDQKYRCHDCPKVLNTLSDLEAHRTSHDSTRPYPCKLCDQRFWTRPSLCSHYKEDHADVVFNCRFCSKSYAIKKSLTRHYKKFHVSEYKHFVRTEQDKGSSEQPLSSKGNTVGESDEENDSSEDSGDSDSAPYFPCHVCGKTFSTSESLEDHQLCHLGEKPHECAECGKCFFQASQLQQHQRMHLSEFQCQTCGRGFVSLFALRKHKHSHGKSRSHRCSRCHLFFTGPSQLAEHMATHREENFPCDICNRVFLSKSSRAEHRKTHSKALEHPLPPISRGKHEQSATRSESSFGFSTEFKYRCGVCNERYRDPEELSEHGCMEAIERPYSCTLCNQHFLHASHLKKHRNINHPSQSNNEFPCSQCNSNFFSSQDFLKHLQNHVDDAAAIKPDPDEEDGAPSHSFICPLCFQLFSDPTKLIRHFRMHPDSTPKSGQKTITSGPVAPREQHSASHTEYECSGCGQNFLGRVAFHQHNCSKQRQAITTNEYSNPSPKTSRPMFQAVGGHEEDEEEEEVDIMAEELYSCLVCSMQFSSKILLLEHQNKQHSEEKPFTCELCGKTFAKKKYLKEHERRHRLKAASQNKSQLIEFKCSHCPAKFTTANDRSVHMRLHAEKEVGDYRCDMCYKSFSQLVLLKRHQESHVGEVVYECTECDKAFAFPHLLEEHQQDHARGSLA